ncbi:MAG: polysaccharide deacetylase family protein [Armatimonadota bacterium]
MALISGAPVAADAGAHLLAAVEALEQGHYQQAAAHARAADKADPRSLLVRVVQAGIQFARFDVHTARKGFREALTDGPASAPAWLGAGACAVREGDFAAAAKHYRTALSTDCRSPADVRACLAYALCQAGDLAGARREVETLHERGTLTPLAMEVEAALRIADRDLEGALGVLAQSALACGDLPPIVMSAATVSLAMPSAGRRVLASLSDRTTEGTRVTASAVPPAGGVEEQGLHIAYPTPGATVSGSIQVTVQPDPQTPLSYLALLIDGKFRALSNSAPYRLTLDTRTCADGPHELRVDGYSAAGVRIAWATRMLVVANGPSAGHEPPRWPASGGARSPAQGPQLAEGRHRTYAALPSGASPRTASAPGQARLLAEAERRLEAWLTLRPHPLNRPYLAGRIREAQRELLDAAAAYEYVFALQPVYPGVRSDLSAVYRQLGLTRAGQRPVELRHLARGGRRAALTFDDGPNPSLTPAILDQLDQYGAKATFFVIGKQAELYPELVREIHRRGHELACHSYSHSDMTELNALEVERELVKTRALVREASGAVVTLFRPPGGHYDAGVGRAAAAMGYDTVFWSANIGDCAGMDADATAQRLLADIDDGAIILLHNGYDETVPALPKLLAALNQRGYKLQTISQILGRQPLRRAAATEGAEGAAGQ